MDLNPVSEYRTVPLIAGQLEAVATLARRVVELVDELPIGEMPASDVGPVGYLEFLHSFGTLEQWIEHVGSFPDIDALIENGEGRYPESVIISNLRAYLRSAMGAGATIDDLAENLRRLAGGVGGAEGLERVLALLTRFARIVQRVRLAAFLLDEANADIRQTIQFNAWSKPGGLDLSEHS